MDEMKEQTNENQMHQKIQFQTNQIQIVKLKQKTSVEKMTKIGIIRKWTIAK